MKHLPAKLAFAGVVAATVLTMSVGSAYAGFSLTGSGSTLATPLITSVFIPDFEAANSGDTVSYSGGGSGAGVAAIAANVGNYGDSDFPMADDTAVAACSVCVQIPWALSATSIVYNLSGVTNLNISGPVLAEIYTGKITMWNDPAIVALNKGTTLPAAAIVPFWRNDASGDSYVFTSYLSDTYPAFKTAIGVSVQPPFTVGTGEKGNSGVAGKISSVADSIGYVSTFYSRDDNLHGASVENASGKFVRPYPASMTAAAALIPNSYLTTANYNTEPVIPDYVAAHGYKPPKVKKGHKAPKVTALDKDALAAYPLSTFTDLLVRNNSSALANVQAFAEFALSSAEQAKGPQYSFAPLPAAVDKWSLAQVKAL
jgi:phosphate transport system substrate-binding protein